MIITVIVFYNYSTGILSTYCSIVQWSPAFSVLILLMYHSYLFCSGSAAPIFDGATVSQVCLASGTTVWVDLVEIGSKISYDV